MKMQSWVWALWMTCSVVWPGQTASDPWPEVEETNRPGCIWWWPGSAVDPENLTWNLETMRAAGLGGASIVPIYGVKGSEDRFVPYLSDRWLEMLQFAVQEADRLGMWLDMTTGSGWRFGGPEVNDSMVDLRVDLVEGELRSRYSGGGVKRGAPGGEGRSINPYSAAALEAYLKKFDAAFKRFPDAVWPRAQYHDSFEYAGDWSLDFPARFLKARGYDLHEHLEELFGPGETDEAVRVKADYRTTLAELHQEYIESWVGWSHQHGFQTRNQAHGAPGNLLDLYAAVDIPETETFGATLLPIPGLRFEERNLRPGGNSTPMVNRMASSAAHVGGKRLTSAETCTWLRNHFNSALSQVKPEVDQLFLNGVNHIFYHGCCYSPKDAEWPGWLFYASTQFNPRNAFWRDFSALNQYVTRCQSILQAGWPSNELLLYWPLADLWHAGGSQRKIQLTVHDTDWLTRSGCGLTAQWLVEQGYGFDFGSDRQIASLRVQDGWLLPPSRLGEERYRAILVPPLRFMPLQTLRSLKALAEAGATILIGTEDDPDVPGYGQLEPRRAELRELLGSIQYRSDRASGVATAAVGAGYVLRSENLERLLPTAGLERESLVDLGLAFIRREAEGGTYHYFIANLGAGVVEGWVKPAVPFETLLWLDPLDGSYGLAKTRPLPAGGSEVFVRLEPGRSLILRASPGANGHDYRPWSYEIPDGEPIPIEATWQVDFIEGAPQLPKSYTTSALGSWTEAADPEADRFAGTARYSVHFDGPTEAPTEWVLDLGVVRESARVRLNGVELGTLWGLPFRTSIPAGVLKRHDNRLEVEATNLSANRIRDLDRRRVEWRIFYDINFVDQNYKPFNAAVWPVVDSGLLGPVTLVPVRAHP